MPRASRQQSSSFLLPLDPLVLVCRTEGDSLEEFRLIKIHFELIPERTKGISILQRRDKRSLSARMGSESELTRSQAAEPEFVRYRQSTEGISLPACLLSVPWEGESETLKRVN